MVHTAHYLRRAVAHIEALRPRPDVVVATGDLVDRGKGKEYRRFRKIVDGLSMPVFLVPGNHDARDSLRGHFMDHAYLPQRGPICYAVDTLPMRLIGLDSTRSKHPGGELDDARLDWFEAALALAPQRPTFVFMHHPPFALGIARIDAHGFGNRDRFTAIVQCNPQIVRVACGHVHRHATSHIGSTLVTTAPSTSYQLVLARTPLGVPGLRLEPPAFALHVWDGGRMQTTIHPIETIAVGSVASLPHVS